MKEMKSENENFLNLMKEVISQSATGIEEEFTRTANSWVACFVGNLDPLDMYLSLAKKRGQISQEEYERLNQKIENLKSKAFLLREQYPDKETIPPDTVKQELLKEFDIFG